RQDAGTAPRRSRNRCHLLTTHTFDHWMPRQEWREVRGHSNRPHARPTATVRNTEGLVQVQVADISPNITRATEPNLGIHVGPIHIDLPAMIMHNAAQFNNAFFKDAVG